MEIFGTIAAFLVVFAFAPQALKTIRTRKTRDLSLPTYILLFLASVCWVVYGYYLHSSSIFFSNIVVGILAFIIIVIKVYEELLSDDARPRNQRRSK